MGSINQQVSRYETTAVYTHPQAKVDIVLVHGLNGGPDKTWTAKNGVFWPTDLLPPALQDAHANVLVYGYNADVYSTKNDHSASHDFVHRHAQSLVTSLTLYRKSEGTFRNPIIWVAHSLGGIVVKRALLYSNDVRATANQDYRSIFVSTFGIIFLGTPHTGSDAAAWGSWLQAMSDVVVPRRFFESEPVLLRTLKRNSEILQEINNHFLDVYQRFRIHMAHEGQKTDIKGTKIMVVDPTSASPQLPGVTYYGIEATHSGMCKFDSSRAPGFRTVSTAIREWVEEAPAVIEVRWHVDEKDQKDRLGAEIKEQMTPYVQQGTGMEVTVRNRRDDFLPSPRTLTGESITSQGPRQLPSPKTISETPRGQASPHSAIFIHPGQFRPNSFFVGREKELKSLHELLMDEKKRAEGTSAVVIQCLPGGGKTHLARQYAIQHRNDYPGGVYWIRAKSQQEMEDGFWQIAKTEALRELFEEAQYKRTDLQNPKKMVELVRAWFQSFEDWLIVFDGIYFDTPGVRSFIPDRTNTSLIFTSTESAISGSYHFDNPIIMRLPLLSAREAQELLLEEMEKKKPWTQDDLSRAEEAVELMGRLPVMIHAAAQQLKATREPLSKYLRSFKSRPRVSGLPAYQAVREELHHRGETAALNLMYILSFFGQHVPVELLGFGVKALDKRTPIRKTDPSSRKSLNHTLMVLIAFALVERNEAAEIQSTSSKSSGENVSLNSESLDILRIHSIVQAFFIDVLAAEKDAPFWLERAVAVFCLSYSDAHRRIRQDSKTGLPDDYRRYCIHGKRLMQHVEYFENKDPSKILVQSKAELQRHLDAIQGEMDTLTRTISANIINGIEDPRLSVFERTNSLSDTDSSQPPDSDPSQPNMPVHLLEDSKQTESPTMYDPYHYHIPYPSPYEGLIPAPMRPPEEFLDSRTLTPQPTRLEAVDTEAHHETPKVSPTRTTSRETYPYSQGTLNVPTRTGTLYTDVYANEEDGYLVSQHRSVKKLEQRRYRDRAGAWRETKLKVSDPRVTISRESAAGYISPTSSQGGRRNRSTSRTRLTAGSEAEMKLMAIKKLAPPAPRGGAYVRDKHGRSSSSGSAARLWSIQGDPQAEQAVEDDPTVVPLFSNGFTTTPAASVMGESAHLGTQPIGIPRLDEATIRQLDEAYAEAGVRSSDLPPSPTPGVRTTNSSPGLPYGPFSPPSRDHPAAVRNDLLSPTRGETLGHQLARHIIDEEDYDEYLSHSVPTTQWHSSIHHPKSAQPWNPLGLRPDGYTSQPMSRNPSSNLPAGVGSGNSSSPRLGSGSGSRGRSAYRSRSQSRAASPSGQAMDSPSRRGRSPVGMGMAIRGVRRPSVVETEPSPRLATFEIDPTSYQAWEARHAQAGPSRVGTIPLLPQEIPEWAQEDLSLRNGPEGDASVEEAGRDGDDGEKDRGAEIEVDGRTQVTDTSMRGEVSVNDASSKGKSKVDIVF